MSEDGRGGVLSPAGIAALAMAAALLAGLIVPLRDGAARVTRIEDAAASVEAVLAAAVAHYARTGDWPSEAGPGEPPPELTDRSGGAPAFGGPGYVLDWEYWPLPDGLPDRPGVRGLAGVTVVSADRTLGRALRQRLGSGRAAYELDGTYTFLIGTR